MIIDLIMSAAIAVSEPVQNPEYLQTPQNLSLKVDDWSLSYQVEEDGFLIQFKNNSEQDICISLSDWIMPYGGYLHAQYGFVQNSDTSKDVIIPMARDENHVAYYNNFALTDNIGYLKVSPGQSLKEKMRFSDFSQPIDKGYAPLFWVKPLPCKSDK